jgi:hypothetical protein
MVLMVAPVPNLHLCLLGAERVVCLLLKLCESHKEPEFLRLEQDGRRKEKLWDKQLSEA